MGKFKVGDHVYGDDWCYGEVLEIYEDGALVGFETGSGGGSMFFDWEYLTLDTDYLPYSHDPELNRIVTELMQDWNRLVAKAGYYNIDIRFAPNCKNTLELYFHDDYPDLLLVDKEVSCELKED